MKIIKQKKLNEALILEDETSKVNDEVTSEEIKAAKEDSVVDNIKLEPIDDLADQIQIGSAAEAEETGKEEIALDAAQAQEVAEVAKTSNIGTVMQTLCTKNKITTVLDDALAGAREDQADGISDGSNNVLIVGLPGSGKTAIVKAWCSAHNLTYYYLDAKDNDLGALIAGMPLKDDTQSNAVVSAKSSKLDPLRNGKDIVLFLDELNRQTKANVRGSLLSLINEHVIAGDTPDGYEHLDNILFAVACVNPPTPGVRSVGDLDDAEKSRFTYTVEFESTKDAAREYYTSKFKKTIKFLNEQLDAGKIDESYYKSRYIRAVHTFELASKLLNDSRFRFDNTSDLDDLRNTENGIPKTMLNSRMLERGIKAGQAQKDKFIKYLKNYSDLLPRAISEIEKILNDYKDPLVTFIKDKNGRLRGKVVEDGAAADQLAVNLNDEIDTSLWNDDAGGTNAPVVSAAEASQRITNDLTAAWNSWF